VLLGLFVVDERRASQPIMPLRLFASPERCAAYAGRILFLGAMMGFWFFITQYLQTVDGYSPLQAGLGFLPMTIVNFAVAIAVPKLTRRYGNGLLLASGLAITTVGMFWLSRLSGETSYLAGVALPMVLIGAGQGAALSPLTAAGISPASTPRTPAPPPGWSTSHTNPAARWAWASSSPSSPPPTQPGSAPTGFSRTASQPRSPSAPACSC
jgi:predicted MFS family arabinose efflux permease